MDHLERYYVALWSKLLPYSRASKAEVPRSYRFGNGVRREPSPHMLIPRLFNTQLVTNKDPISVAAFAQM